MSRNPSPRVSDHHIMNGWVISPGPCSPIVTAANSLPQPESDDAAEASAAFLPFVPATNNLPRPESNATAEAAAAFWPFEPRTNNLPGPTSDETIEPAAAFWPFDPAANNLPQPVSDDAAELTIAIGNLSYTFSTVCALLSSVAKIFPPDPQQIEFDIRVLGKSFHDKGIAQMSRSERMDVEKLARALSWVHAGSVMLDDQIKDFKEAISKAAKQCEVGQKVMQVLDEKEDSFQRHESDPHSSTSNHARADDGNESTTKILDPLHEQFKYLSKRPEDLAMHSMHLGYATLLHKPSAAQAKNNAESSNTPQDTPITLASIKATLLETLGQYKIRYTNESLADCTNSIPQMLVFFQTHIEELREEIHGETHLRDITQRVLDEKSAEFERMHRYYANLDTAKRLENDRLRAELAYSKNKNKEYQEEIAEEERFRSQTMVLAELRREELEKLRAELDEKTRRIFMLEVQLAVANEDKDGDVEMEGRLLNEMMDDK